MKLDFMTNIKINKINDHYYTVTANTKRFGRSEIMFEGINEKECNSYVEDNLQAEIPDKYDDSKAWAIKRTKDGHYYLRQLKYEGCEIIYKSKFVRVRKAYIEGLFN